MQFTWKPGFVALPCFLLQGCDDAVTDGFFIATAIDYRSKTVLELNQVDWSIKKYVYINHNERVSYVRAYQYLSDQLPIKE